MEEDILENLREAFLQHGSISNLMGLKGESEFPNRDETE